MVTTAMLGTFQGDVNRRREFLAAVGRHPAENS
jgi:GTP cyclohydrolase I